MDEDEITPADLEAYVDGQLDPARRIAVEDHLGRRPDAAARVMEGLRHRDEIRLFLGSDPGPTPPATAALARRLGRALRVRSLAPPARGGLLAASLVALGWFGHAGLGPLLGGPAEPDVATHPAEVLADDAAQALRVLQLKVVAAGSPGPERGREAGGRPPVLPSGYRRIGAQVIPWDGGRASLELYATPRGDRLVLLRAETPTAGAEAPAGEQVDGVTTVKWWEGREAYAISGQVPMADMMSIARGMAPNS